MYASACAMGPVTMARLHSSIADLCGPPSRFYDSSSNISNISIIIVISTSSVDRPPSRKIVHYIPLTALMSARRSSNTGDEPVFRVYNARSGLQRHVTCAHDTLLDVIDAVCQMYQSVIMACLIRPCVRVSKNCLGKGLLCFWSSEYRWSS